MKQRRKMAIVVLVIAVVVAASGFYLFQFGSPWEGKETGGIEGTVTDNEGEPVAGMVVYIVNGTTAFPEMAVITDDEGFYLIETVPQGMFEVGVHDREGNRVGIESVAVSGGEISTLNFVIPTSVRMISFEEAVEFALEGGKLRWQFVEYRWLGMFEGEPFVTPDGLVEGYLEWRAGNGTLYEAEYPGGEIHGAIEHFTGVEDAEEYYVWAIKLMDGTPAWIDARNGELLSRLPPRVPGLVTFETCVRIVYAPQKRIEEWVVQEYKRIGDFDPRFPPFETPDGVVKGHLLWRVGNGTLYQVQPPFIRDIRGEVLYIEVPDDTAEYYVWEITTEDKAYYIDARNGITRLILEEAAHLTPEKVRDAVMSYIRDHHSHTERLMGDIEWSGGDVTPPGLIGKTTYQYLGGGWNVTISWAVVAEPTYDVRVEYKSPTGDLSIFWEGTVDQTGEVKEKIKGSYQNVESVRDAVMDYIRENHLDAAAFIKDLIWSVTQPEPVPGWTEYQFIGNGWNVTIGYVVYYDITYEVTAEHQQEGIAWTGTVYDGIVIETSYKKV